MDRRTSRRALSTKPLLWAAGSFVVGWVCARVRRANGTQPSPAPPYHRMTVNGAHHSQSVGVDQSDAARMTSLVEQTTDVILVVDNEDRIRFASPSARHLLGTSLLLGRDLLEFVETDEQRTARFLLRHVRAAPGDGVAHADVAIRTADGQVARTELVCRDLRADASVRGLVLTLRDVTTQRRLEAELTRQVFVDRLTS